MTTAEIYELSIPEPTSGCWLWLGMVTQGGYGFVWSPQHAGRRTRLKAHRLAFAAAHGREPVRHVLHRCDTPSCVNPHHLFEGDDAANHHDKQLKGRAAKKLSSADVDLIRRSSASQRELAWLLGVSHVTVGRVRRGESWEHLP